MNSKQIFCAEQLTKSYKGCVALNNVSFSINEGDIFGLIGENGAGKTTLMKLIAGSAHASSGKLSIMGCSDNRLQSMRKNMGVIIENPAYYGDMTGIENLELIRLAKDIKDKTEVNKILGIVGLTDAKSQKVGKYSLGMRQRLGLAMALIGSPRFLILDEPINGLDPNGIVDMRNLIIKLNKEYGITLLISSHILTELHQVATRYGILHKGELTALHTAQELQKQCKKYINIIHKDNSKNIVNVLNQYNVKDMHAAGNVIRFIDTGNLPDGFLLLLISQGLNITEYYTKQESLEEYFISLTKGGR